MKKIALIGSAPSSVRLAPFSDPSWTIWSCSPGAMQHLSRVDAHFELHRWEPHQSWFHPDYIKFMAGLGKPVYMIEPVAAIPMSVPYPKDEVLRYVWSRNQKPDGTLIDMTFNPNAFGSSLSWMLALAITQLPDEIGLWGVDMAAGEEYGPQKDGCLELIHVARCLGIKVTTPPESDLLRPTPLYGFREVDPMFIKLQTRVQELSEQLAKAEAEYQDADRRRWFFKGALDDCLYVQKTWVHDPVQIERIYSNPPTIAPAPVATVETPVPMEATPVGKPIVKAKRTKANGTRHPEEAAH
jgi:hypothetical protein